MTIKVGHYNWHKLAEKGDFYPGDLPQDWRLVFYANEFECVELQVDTFNQDELEELCEDLPEHFEVLISANSTQFCGRVQALLTSLEVNVVATISGEMKDCHDLVVNDYVITHQNEVQSLKQWRVFVEQWIDTLNDKQGIILLDAEHISAAQALDLRLMIEMMGL